MYSLRLAEGNETRAYAEGDTVQEVAEKFKMELIKSAINRFK